MISLFHGKSLSRKRAVFLCQKANQGTNLLALIDGAKAIGLRSSAFKLDTESLSARAELPCLLYLNNNHYVILYKIRKDKFYIADPKLGKYALSTGDLESKWLNSEGLGVACVFSPTISFSKDHIEEKSNKKDGVRFIFKYLFQFKRYLVQLALGALVISLLSFIAPFLTKSVVDYGITNSDKNFILLIFIAQLALFLGRTATEFIRGWLLVHIGVRVNVAVVSDFLQKIMRLPMTFFNSRNMGDILQRIADHHKIEELITSHSITFIFSLLNVLVFSLILFFYSTSIFTIFIVGSVVAVLWPLPFLKKRRLLDYDYFTQLSSHQHAVVQIVYGMSEIKMNQAQQQQHENWSRIQSRIFSNKVRALTIEQYQQIGTKIFNDGKSILISFVAALQVVSGELTLGMMIATTYILGQMSAPMEQLIGFIHKFQDAKLSMERLNEIHDLSDENEARSHVKFNFDEHTIIKANNVSFAYQKSDKKLTLKNLNFSIPYKKTTAIVGTSGSGKTTLLKLLLKFADPTSGNLSVGGIDLNDVCPEYWRSKCGVVFQDGYIFSNSVAENIAFGDENINMQRVVRAAQMANIHDEIKLLNQGYDTKVGEEGRSLSGGQTQRILIARAIYKNPEVLFFDEATSALDANNERIIQKNLENFFDGRTVLIVAHRLSTVMNADNIIVLHNGEIVEQGTHQSLIKAEAAYFNLVKNQLELGS